MIIGDIAFSSQISNATRDFIISLLQSDPFKRITVKEIL